MASMSYKIWVLYGWFCPRCPCLWLWQLRFRLSASEPRAALALPRPPLALWAAGGLGRARALRWMPLGVFRRLRAAGARSGPAPLIAARCPRSETLAALAGVVQKKGQRTNPESGAIIDLPCAGHFRYTENKA